MGVEITGEFGGSAHKEETQVFSGQIATLQQIFCGKVIVKVGPDAKHRRGLLLIFSDGSSVGIKCAPQPKVTELSFLGVEATQPRQFHVATG